MPSDRARIVAFRLASHHLTTPLPTEDWQAAAGVAGLQTSKVDSAAVALAVRRPQLRPADITHALRRSKTLLTVWAMRGAPYVVPTPDVAVFTSGALPDPHLSLRDFASGWAEHLQQAGVDLAQLIRDSAAAARAALRAGPLPVDDLRTAIYAALPQLHPIARPDFARADMPEALFRLLGPLGVVCIVEGEGTKAVVGALDAWLQQEATAEDPRAAKLELLRRFLHAYGPASERMFADWTARSMAETRALFADLDDELMPAVVAGEDRWLLARDEQALRAPPDPTGVHLLPPLDPFLAQRDRATLVPDKMLARKVWKPLGAPGAVLQDGQVIGIWRSTRKARRLAVTLEAFSALSPAALSAVERCAARLAPFRGADDSSVDVVA